MEPLWAEIDRILLVLEKALCREVRKSLIKSAEENDHVGSDMQVFLMGQDRGALGRLLIYHSSKLTFP